MKSLDWEIKESPLYLAGGQALKTHKAIVREDNGQVLNVCRKTYHPFSNADFAAFADALGQAANGAYSFVGYEEFQGGQVVLAQFESLRDIELCGWKAHNYLTLGNGHNGKHALFVAARQTLVRCSNQFGSMVKSLSIRHTASMQARAAEFLKIVSLYEARAAYQKEILERGMNVKISRRLIEGCIEAVLGKELADASTRTQNQAVSLGASIEREIQEVGANAFGLFNGVTHYTTHTMKAKGNDLFGLRPKLNEKGFAFVEQLVAAN